MPKGAKKAGGSTSRQLVLHGPKTDFTLYDFAHATPTEAKSSGRVKKAVANALVTEVKEVTRNCTKSSEALAWYEKDLSDFDLSETDDTCDNEGEEEGDDGATVAKQRRCKRGSEIQKEPDHGQVWPLDLWFLVGRFVAPEDVSIFARICHGSHIVTHSANFWCSLYKRYYNPDIVVPKALRLQSMDRVHGLVERVVRSLYYCYPLFQDRVRGLSPFRNDPDLLIGAKCAVMWYKRINNVWHFFFKFLKPNHNACLLVRRQGKHRYRRDYLMEENNIHYNRGENCCILQVVTNDFISLPVIMGQYLIQVAISVGHDMRYHKLKLVFNSEFISSKNRKDSFLNSSMLVMDPVANMKVLQWWDPRYPR